MDICSKHFCCPISSPVDSNLWNANVSRLTRRRNLTLRDSLTFHSTTSSCSWKHCLWNSLFVFLSLSIYLSFLSGRERQGYPSFFAKYVLKMTHSVDQKKKKWLNGLWFGRPWLLWAGGRTEPAQCSFKSSSPSASSLFKSLSKWIKSEFSLETNDGRNEEQEYERWLPIMPWMNSYTLA